MERLVNCDIIIDIESIDNVSGGNQEYKIACTAKDGSRYRLVFDYVWFIRCSVENGYIARAARFCLDAKEHSSVMLVEDSIAVLDLEYQASYTLPVETLKDYIISDSVGTIVEVLTIVDPRMIKRKHLPYPKERKDVKGREFDLTFDEGSLEALRKMKSKKAFKVHAIGAGPVYQKILFESNGMYVQFINEVGSVPGLYEEYPRLSIVTLSNPPEGSSEYREVATGQCVNDILFFRDKTVWSYDDETWRVIGDIAVELVLEHGEKIVIRLCDSPSGFLIMERYDLFYDLLRNEEELRVFKSDAPTNLSRTRFELA